MYIRKDIIEYRKSLVCLGSLDTIPDIYGKPSCQYLIVCDRNDLLFLILSKHPVAKLGERIGFPVPRGNIYCQTAAYPVFRPRFVQSGFLLLCDDLPFPVRVPPDDPVLPYRLQHFCQHLKMRS